MNADTLDIVNFRDIGGKTGEAGTLKPGIFYRSAQLDRLDQTQIKALQQDKHIQHIYDFRSDAEIAANPDVTIPGAEYQHIDILGAGSGVPSFDMMLKNAKNSFNFMMETYSDLVLDSEAQARYHEFFMAILNDDTPLIFHCFAGKDRTGFAAAVILKMAGIDHQQIMDDYLRTNEMRKQANQETMEAIKSHLNVAEQDLAGLQTLLEVDARYLEHAVAVMRTKFGSFDNYLTQGLHLPEDYVQHFQRRFVV
ncbi:tyrosine-protein phosphatase [Weissella viridescens]|uniref:Tyrosine-protein phosphatase n=1 Tax=Weissella viridescens TaxID=1629 RepID=A0A3P2RDW2_WEIVI|nr:tyrosine-protein phosphatase [Weissella viridescens]RRG18807.1 tyrosine-protein phosphatase [Weissella viridescens]